MTTPDPRDERDVEPLGGAVAPSTGQDDGSDGMAGPVFPPEETEPDAHDVGGRPGLGRLLHRDE